MQSFTPSQLEALTGLSVGSQRAWDKQGLFLDRVERTKGGQRRFSVSDMVFVSASRTLADMGYHLPLAVRVVGLCLSEIVDRIKDREPASGELGYPFIFIWRSEDTTEEAGRLAALGEWQRIASEDEIGFEFIRMADLNRIPVFSRSGGFVVVPADIARRLPQAIRDFAEENLH